MRILLSSRRTFLQRRLGPAALFTAGELFIFGKNILNLHGVEFLNVGQSKTLRRLPKNCHSGMFYAQLIMQGSR